MGNERKSKRSIDGSVGGLVWVRRRNGSWWPGRIMGLHELSDGCLVSPRLGTPVKLLGREDASVDWYNLEKSKRVKSFRCGEYDNCIEKAKAAAATSNRKAVKYARREDAILHALELENAIESSHRNIHIWTDKRNSLKQDTRAKRQQNILTCNKQHMSANGTANMLEATQTTDLSQSSLSLEDLHHNSISKAHFLLKKRKTPNDSEEDGEGRKRMRDLEELGRTVALERSGLSEGSHEFAQLDSTALSEHNICYGSSGTVINGGKSSCSFLKRKRSQVAYTHENLKRKDRRRALTKVLETTAMVSVPVFCDGLSPGLSYFQRDGSGASYEKDAPLDPSEHTCEPEIDAGQAQSQSKDSEFSIKSAIPENDFSDGLFDVPFVVEEKHSEGFRHVFAPCTLGRVQSGALGQDSAHHSQVGSVSFSTALDESGSAIMAMDVVNVCPKNEKGTSKWQQKRKRDSRSRKKTKKRKSINLRRSAARDDKLDAFVDGTQQINGFSASSNQKSEINTYDELLSLDDYDHVSKDVSEFNNSIYYGSSLGNVEAAVQSAGSRDNRVNLSHVYSPTAKSRFISQLRYQNEDYHERYVTVSALFDVNLEVRGSYHGQHVPLVSLMSKLNGKAIVGHPITVEVLDDGYYDILSRIDCCHTSNKCELFEVPTNNTSDQSINISDENLKARAGYVVKSCIASEPQSSLSPRKCLQNSKFGFLSKRTRKLSSFTSRIEDRKPVIKNLEAPAVACVPLKVVFGRINEGLNFAARSAVTPQEENP
ncbi:hypothetical protein Sjap_019477 [Stephania japonica]|uniref:PWWP domain-containing protein n=1 Tax=Stephania japonica TaxID=461633 RepID=A0AAP0HUR8_9MAGN